MIVDISFSSTFIICIIIIHTHLQRFQTRQKLTLIEMEELSESIYVEDESDALLPAPEVDVLRSSSSFNGLDRSRHININIAQAGKKTSKLKSPSFCDLRLIGWVCLRIPMLAFFIWLEIVAFQIDRSYDTIEGMGIVYITCSLSYSLVDLSLFAFLRIKLWVFLIFRVLPNFVVLVLDLIMMCIFMSQVNFLIFLPVVLTSFSSHVLVYKFIKPIYLHYLAWDVAVFYYKKELVTRYIKNQQKLETGFARKPISTSDKTISEVERHMKKFGLRIFSLESLVDTARKTCLRKELESEERACALDLRIRKLCSVFNTELLSENWSKCWICVVEALESLVLRNKASPQWMQVHILVANTRWHDELESPWAPTEELFSYYLKHLIFLCPETEMASVCENLKFHCKYLDDEVTNIVHLIEKMFGCKQESFYTVKFMANLNTKNPRLHKNLIPLICDAGLSLYRKCLAKGEFGLADGWLALRFSEQAEYADLSRLVRDTIKALNCPDRSGSRRQLNGHHEGVAESYTVPAINFKSVSKRQKKAWWMQSKSQSCNIKIKNVEIATTEEPNSVDSLATTKSAPASSSHDCCIELTPEEQVQRRRQQCLAANRDAADLFHKSARISDEDMNRFPFELVALDKQNERIVLKWTIGGVEQERVTNIKQNFPYHCMSFNYNAVENDWEISADWCRVEGLLAVEQEGASRICLTGDSCPLLQTTEALQTAPFNLKSVFKQHRETREHNIDNYLGEVRSQSVARYYVDRFQNATNDRFGYLRMLNSTFVLVFDDVERRTVIDMMAREMYVQGDKFEKFTNNWTFVNKAVNTSILEAFSHFTHHDSEGALMVTDLQGWVTQLVDATFTLDNIILLLTDPVIHCPSVNTKRFGLVNEGEEGIRKFYTVIHPECNEICKELRLKRPEGMNPEPPTTNVDAETVVNIQVDAEIESTDAVHRKLDSLSGELRRVRVENASLRAEMDSLKRIVSAHSRSRFP